MIELRDIRKTYPDGTVALSGVDLEIGEGLLGVLGPNGAGKTTLLSILSMAREPSSGTRRYFELDDRRRHRPRIRRMLGYLPQDFALVEDLTGFEYLELCAELRQVPLRRRALRRRIQALLEEVELWRVAHRRAASYSGGMQRRLGLAQALIHAPRFLVVDEPTAGLDPEERMRFRNLITDLADEIPVLLSTHIVEDIEATCPRLVMIEGGRKIFDGPPGELLRRARGRLWKLPPGAEIPCGAHRLGQRAGEDGALHQVVAADVRPSAGEAIAPNLEDASAVYRVESRQSESPAPGETTKENDHVDEQDVSG